MGNEVRVPTVFQLEVSECGPASLAMMLAYYGKHVSLDRLRLDCQVSARDGCKASDLIRAAQSYGLKAQGYHQGTEAVKKMAFPVIIHWKFNHFIILEGYDQGKGRFYLRDSCVGAFTVPEDEFARDFTGIVIVLAKTAAFTADGEQENLFKTVTKYIRINKATALFIGVTSLFLVILEMVFPLLSGYFVDKVLHGNAQSLLPALAAGMIITAVLRGLVLWAQKHLLLKWENKTNAQMSGKVFRHLLRLPLLFFSSRYEAGMRVLITGRIARTFFHEFTGAFLNSLTVLAYAAFLFWYSPGLAVAAAGLLTASFVYLLIAVKTKTDMAQKARQEQQHFQGEAFSELVVMETLKAMGGEDGAFIKWARRQARAGNDAQLMGKHTMSLTIAADSAALAGNILLVLAGGLAVMAGEMTAGMFVALQGMMTGAFSRLAGLAGTAVQARMLGKDIARLDDVMECPADECFRRPRRKLPKLSGGLTVSNLTFGYNKNQPPLIENFSLTLKPGTQVALVGGSGSGKSTVAKLIAGLYKPWSGEICFDGIPYAELPKAVLNNSLSMVEQESHLFSGSIKDNLTLWDDTADGAAVIRAARDACIHDDITARPGGYAAEVAEDGLNFSGGQGQRLEIARALVKNPAIVIMDEATSALDAGTEQAITGHLRRRGCTLIIVAHRLSAIRDCDEIIVLDKGRIAERGTHGQLIGRDGPYSRLIAAE